MLAAVSALPVVELRGGVPVGFWMQMDPISVYLCCVLGNLLPILPLLFALRLPFVRKLFRSTIHRATKVAEGEQSHAFWDRSNVREGFGPLG